MGNSKLNDSTAMDKKFILQNLTDAFDVLKDSWDTKKEAIINCIVETEQYDGSLSMDMWLYILQNHMPVINEDEAGCLVDDVFDRFVRRNEEYTFLHSICRVCLNHIVPHLILKDDLINAIFGKTCNAGFKFHYGESASELDEFHYNIVCISCILLLGNKHSIEVLIKSLSQNLFTQCLSMGKLLLKANECIEYIGRNEKELGKKYEISEEVKEALLNSLGFIEDKIERAECTVAFLSL